MKPAFTSSVPVRSASPVLSHVLELAHNRTAASWTKSMGSNPECGTPPVRANAARSKNGSILPHTAGSIPVLASIESVMPPLHELRLHDLEPLFDALEPLRCVGAFHQERRELAEETLPS